MSIEIPHSPDSQHSHSDDQRDADIRSVASRVEEWLSSSSHGDTPDCPETLDTQPRHRDVVNPSATRIGYPDDPEDDLDGRLRALNAERRAAMQGNSERREQLDDETLQTAAFGRSPYRDPALPPFVHREPTPDEPSAADD